MRGAARGQGAGNGPEPAEPGLGRMAPLSLGAAALVSLYAALELRPLFADGAHYFVRILESEAYWLEAPARRTVELVRQLPLLAALKLGVADTPALAVIFGLSIDVLPLALTALCWPALPRGRKHFFAFPLLHYFAGTVGAAFAPIVEGPAAAAWFWLLLFLLLFRAPRGPALAPMLALAAGTVLLHEGMVLLAPILAAAALWRAKHAETPAARAVFLALAAWFAIVVAVQAAHLVDPARPENRAAFFTALVSFWWLFGLWGSLNLPALFGLLALAMLVPLALRRASPGARDVSPLACAAFGAAILAAAFYAAMSDQLYAAQAQFNARNHAILISVPLGAIALYAAVKPAVAERLPFRAAAMLAAWLAAASALWHVESARRWSAYLDVFRGVLKANSGLVAWEDARAKLAPAGARLFEGYSHFWIEPSMSIVLAPAGKIAVVVAARRAAGWYPFDARDPAQLPRSRFWNYDAYLAAEKVR